jgi:hypothetical protein
MTMSKSKAKPSEGTPQGPVDRGFAADYFGASPVASALNLPQERDSLENRNHTNTHPPPARSKPDISTLQGIGHFYFALTVASLPGAGRFLYLQIATSLGRSDLESSRAFALLACDTGFVGVRFTVAAASAVFEALILLAGSAPRPAQAQFVAPESSRPVQVTPSPPMFSPWYVESLGDILKLEESDVARLQQRLAGNPEDFPTRLKLMAYHQRADRAGRKEDRAQRVQHALWLIEHHPDSELLHSPVSRFSPGELTPSDYRRAVALWNGAAKAKSGDAAVQWNAASFFQDLDPEHYMRYLEATAAADPNHPFALRPLADFYALSILGRGQLAARAAAGLEASNNVWVLGNAAYMFQSQYNRTLQMGVPNPRAAEFAERYFLRAKALDPKLSRQAILPQLDPQAIASAR